MFKKLVIFYSCLLLLDQRGKADSSQQFRQSVEGGAHQSLSGQFITRNAPYISDYSARLNLTTNMVRLDPGLIGVSCERIKKALLDELGVRDQWKGKIFLELHQADSLNETVVINSLLLDNKWVYHVQLPDVLDKSQFISAVVNAILLEMANRQADRGTEIPAWLSQGLTTQLIASSATELVLQTPHKSERGVFLTRFSHDNHRENPLLLAHEYLQMSTPLTMEELSWPKPGQLDGDAGLVYRSSAQLFVNKLLQLKDGRTAMLAMLQELPQHLNWQISFFHAFKVDFSGQLELDKWWALQVNDFTGRDLSLVWDNREGWKKLDEVLRPTVEVRTAKNDAPFRTQVTLETIITDWDHPRQSHVIEEKLQQLLLLRYRVAPDLSVLAEDYRQALIYYLKHRDGLPFNPENRNLYAPPSDSVAVETIRTLKQLDARLERLRPKADPIPAITSNSPK